MTVRKAGGMLCLAKGIRKGKSIHERYRKLFREPKYMCRECGRVAADDNHLCYPERL